MIEIDVEARRIDVKEGEALRILVLGQFGERTGRPVAVDRDNFDDVLRGMDVRLGGFQFRELDDFHPDRLYERLDLFGELRESRQASAPEPPVERPRGAPNVADFVGPASLLDEIVEGGKDPLKQYVADLVKPHLAPPSDPNAPKREAAAGEQMRGLLHHPRFQTLESAWRGLDFLIRGIDDDVRISIFNVAKATLATDLMETHDLRNTVSHHILTGTRWAAVGANYAFGAGDVDIELLGRIALLASKARAPFLAQGAADMGPHWPELRSIPEASWIGLALPRFLLRWPYGRKTSRIEAFEFEEDGHLWGNPVFACLRLLVKEDEEELDLDGLPMPCTETAFTEAQARALIDQGLMPLVWFQNSDRVRLAGFRAINSASLPRPR